MGYRIAIFSYAFIWLILHADSRSSVEGSLWLIQMTNLSYTLFVIALGSMAILCSVYAILYFVRQEVLVRFIPKKDFPEARIYKQDNIPWYVKIVWLVYVTALPSNFLVVFGYWILVYNPCDDDSSMQINQTLSQNDSSSQMPNTTASTVNCANLDAANFHVHLINGLLILIDLFVSRIPYQLLHFFYPCIFTFCYSLFTIFYWLGGGTNRFGNPYVYTIINYSNRPATAFVFAILLTISPLLMCLIIFPLSWLRDCIYRRIPCCYRDVKKLPHREYELDHQLSKNGANGSGTTL